MELTIYDIIKGVISTPKSLALRQKYGKITFRVHTESNKIEIRKAIEKIWNVKVEDVRIVHLHGKNKMVKRRSYQTSAVKKAIITLKKGYNIDLPEQYETMGVSEAVAEKVKDEGV